MEEYMNTLGKWDLRDTETGAIEVRKRVEYSARIRPILYQLFRKHGADPAMIETVGSAGNSNLSTPESDLDLLIRAKPGITPAEYSHLTNTGPLVLQELQEVLGEELQYKIDLWYKLWEKRDRRKSTIPTMTQKIFPDERMKKFVQELLKR